jgi:hypothetical protein
MKRGLVLAVAVLLCAHFTRVWGVGWSGIAIDIRSGQPVAGVKFWGGAQGRVDLTDPSTTGADGHFAVNYSAPLDLNFWVWYALRGYDQSTPPRYWANERKRQSPSGAVVVRMVPLNAFIRGVVKNAATGEPIPGISVDQGAPGAYQQRTTTDAQGQFQFNVAAYSGLHNYEEGIPLAEQIPHEPWDVGTPITNYWLEVFQPGYKRLGTYDWPSFQINLISSVSPELHTFVTLNLAPAGSAATNSATVTQQDPYAYQRCAANVFSPDELADPAIAGEAADPDNDGLSNKAECAAGTNPRNPDTDGDGLLDGWEVSFGLNPLVADATADADGDGFNNKIEYLYGSRPRDATSVPDITVGIVRAVRVDFATHVGVRYQLQRADTADGPWTNVAEPFVGDGTSVRRYFDAEPNQVQFFRLTVSLP